jgi:NAD-dependent SIR2 family protein deacetylase
MLVSRLADLVRAGRTTMLTGAGCSTGSGIPDYRGTGRPTRRAPIQYREFLASEPTRRRYWARSMAGWPHVATARPNPAHHAIANLERDGWVAGVITQNVDGLHPAAGSQRVVELHGSLARVRCLDCDARSSRAELQDRMRAANAGWSDGMVAPDGDADLPDHCFADFKVQGCLRCGGVLKPDVVFFGETVPRPVVDAAWALLDEADLLLVVGSSLAVFSGFRFVIRASERGVPIAIMNRGPTRGDDRAALRLDGFVEELLPALEAAVG